MSLPRRIALLRWAAETKAWVVEDDYDSEFRFKGKPLPALKSLDRHDRVLFVGTFSKVLAPGLRIGYLVSPLPLVGRFAEAARLLLPPPAPLIQATIAVFIEQGYLARHIRRMRQLYAERRAALVDALMRHVRPTLRIDMERHGMHLLARLPRGTDDVALIRRVAREGIVVRALSACGVARPYEPGLVIGFANVDARKAPDVARRLARNDVASLANAWLPVTSVRADNALNTAEGAVTCRLERSAPVRSPSTSPATLSPRDMKSC